MPAMRRLSNRSVSASGDVETCSAVAALSGAGSGCSRASTFKTCSTLTRPRRTLSNANASATPSAAHPRRVPYVAVERRGHGHGHEVRPPVVQHLGHAEPVVLGITHPFPQGPATLAQPGVEFDEGAEALLARVDPHTSIQMLRRLSCTFFSTTPFSQPLFAPVELEGFAEFKGQGHEGLRADELALLVAPLANEVGQPGAATVVALARELDVQCALRFAARAWRSARRPPVPV